MYRALGNDLRRFSIQMCLSLRFPYIHMHMIYYGRLYRVLAAHHALPWTEPYKRMQTKHLCALLKFSSPAKPLLIRQVQLSLFEPLFFPWPFHEILYFVQSDHFQRRKSFACPPLWKVKFNPVSRRFQNNVLSILICTLFWGRQRAVLEIISFRKLSYPSRSKELPSVKNVIILNTTDRYLFHRPNMAGVLNRVLTIILVACSGSITSNNSFLVVLLSNSTCKGEP